MVVPLFVRAGRGSKKMQKAFCSTKEPVLSQLAQIKQPNWEQTTQEINITAVIYLRREGAESYEELESRGQRIRQILNSTDSFHSDTPTNAVHGGDGGGGWKGGSGGHFSSAVSQEGRVMVAFTLKEVRMVIESGLVAATRTHSRREDD